MKCVKCKFKDRNTGVCTYPFAVVAVGDKVLDKKGNVVGCAHGRKKKCEGCGKELMLPEGNIYIPSDSDGSKRELYCRKCYDKKTKERTH